MRRPALYEIIFRDLLFTLFVFLVLSAHATAQDNQTQVKRDSSQAPVAQSIVKGRAVYEDTGQPAQRERIQLVAAELSGDSVMIHRASRTRSLRTHRESRCSRAS